MKEKIHPKYMQAKVICACGNTFTTGSTKPELHVEVCSNCHPFYTGKQKILDTGGRVARFTGIPSGPDGRLDADRLGTALGCGFRVVRWHLDEPAGITPQARR